MEVGEREREGETETDLRRQRQTDTHIEYSPCATCPTAQYTLRWGQWQPSEWEARGQHHQVGTETYTK